MTALEWRPIDLTSDPSDAEFHGDPQDLAEAFGELLATLRRPAWHELAACRGRGPKLWFPKRGEPVATAQAVCSGCPVQTDCMEAGMTEQHGIWGGLGAQGRKDVRNGRGYAVATRKAVPVAELIAFIEAHPALTWPERHRLWNEAHPERPFGSVGALASAYRYVRAAREVA